MRWVVTGSSFFFRRQHLDKRRNPFRDRVSNRVPNGRRILR